MVYARSCVQLSVTAPGDRKRKECQYRVVGFELLCTAPFAHVIAASYKRGAAHHCELEMYVCDLCNQSFSTQGSLKRHRESVHRQSAGFSCQVCSQRFYRKDHLRRHMKMHQTAELRGNSAACPTDKTFVDLPPPPPSPPPKKHDETPVCDLCAKTFASQKTLKRHRQTVHRQSGGFSCRVCDQRFYRKDNLRKHHISKHGDEEYEAPASYPCPICQKGFHYRSHLGEHLKTNSATTSSLPTSPASPLAPPTLGLRTDARTCPAELPASVPEDCQQCYRDNWSQMRSH